MFAQLKNTYPKIAQHITLKKSAVEEKKLLEDPTFQKQEKERIAGFKAKGELVNEGAPKKQKLGGFAIRLY